MFPLQAALALNTLFGKKREKPQLLHHCHPILLYPQLSTDFKAERDWFFFLCLCSRIHNSKYCPGIFHKTLCKSRGGESWATENGEAKWEAVLWPRCHQNLVFFLTFSHFYFLFRSMYQLISFVLKCSMYSHSTENIPSSGKALNVQEINLQYAKGWQGTVFFYSSPIIAHSEACLWMLPRLWVINQAIILDISFKELP